MSYRRINCWAVLGWLSVLAASSVWADLTLDAGSVHDTPAGVRIGRGVEVFETSGSAALRFQSEGIVVPLASSLAAESGTVTVRFQLPEDWPSASRATLFHVGAQSLVHTTLFANSGRLTAVYQAGPDDYASINFRASLQWQGGTWHDAVFSWRSDGCTTTVPGEHLRSLKRST